MLRPAAFGTVALALALSWFGAAPATGAGERTASGIMQARAMGETAQAPAARRPPRDRYRVVQPGPPSPVGANPDTYYYALQHGQCALLRVITLDSTDPTDQLFSALADLCLAFDRSYVADWAAAQAAFDASAAVGDCLSISARASLQRALVNHAAHPARLPDFRPFPGGTACEPKLTFVGTTTSASGTRTSLFALGLHTFDVTRLRVNGTWHQAASRLVSDECSRIDVPGLAAPATGTTVTVQIGGVDYVSPASQWLIGSVLSNDDAQDVDSSVCQPNTVAHPAPPSAPTTP